MENQQLNNEVLNAIYGALHQIFDSQENNKSSRKEPETKEDKDVTISISGDSVSILKTIATSENIKDKVAGVADGFKMLNEQLAQFEKLNAFGPDGTLSQLANFLELTSKLNAELSKNIMDNNAGDKIIKFISAIGHAFTDVSLLKIRAAGLVLNEKTGDNIGGFFAGFMKRFDDLKDSTIENAPAIIKNIDEALRALMNPLITVAAIGVIIGASDTVATLVSIGAIILAVGGLIAVTAAAGAFAAKVLDDKGLESLDDYIKSLSALLISTAAAAYIIDHVGITGVIDAIALMGAVIIGIGVIALWTALVSKIAEGAIDTLKPLNAFVSDIIVLMGVITLLSVVIKLVGFDTIMEAITATMTVLLAVGVIMILVAVLSVPLRIAAPGLVAIAEFIVALSATLLIFEAAVAIASVIPLEGLGMVITILALIGITIVITTFLANLLAKPVDGADISSPTGLFGLFLRGGKVQTAADGIVAIGVFIVVLSLSIILIEGAAKLAEKVPLEGLGKVVLILGGIGAILYALYNVSKLFTDDTLKDMAMIEGLMLGIEAIALLGILVSNKAKRIDLEGFGKMIGLMATLGLIMTGLMAISKYISMGGKKELMLMAGIEALMLGLIKIVDITVDVATAARKVNASDVGWVIGIMSMIALIPGAMVAIMTGLTSAGLGLSVAAGEALTAGILALMYGSIKIVDAAVDVARKARFVRDRDMDNVVNILYQIAKIPVGLTAIMAAISAIPGGGLAVAAGEALTAGILGLMSGVVNIVDSFTDTVIKYKTAEEKLGVNFGTAGDKIGKGFVDFISGINDGIGISGAIKAALIGNLMNNFKPVIDIVSDFTKIISKVASNQIVVGYDANGKAIYESIAEGVYTQAATAVTNGFVAFISGLDKGLSQLSIWTLLIIDDLGESLKPIMDSVASFTDAIMKAATGTYKITGEDGKDESIHVSREDLENAATIIVDQFNSFVKKLDTGFHMNIPFTTSAIEELSENVGPIMEAVGDFTDAIMKAATGTYKITGEDGKDITMHVTKDDMQNAASTIVSSFSLFLVTMKDELKGQSGDIEDILDDLNDGIGDTISALANFGNMIVKMASATYPVAWDKNGKVIKESVIRPSMFKQAAISVTWSFVTFLKTLNTNLKNMRDDIESTLEALQDITPVIKSTADFGDMIIKLATAQYPDLWDENGKPIHYKKIDSSYYTLAATNIAKAMTTFLITLKTRLSAPATLAVVEDTMDALGNITPVIKAASQFNDMVMKVVSGQLPDLWDENGNPIHYQRLSGALYKTAAGNIALALEEFITNINSAFNKPGVADQLQTTLDMIQSYVSPIVKEVTKFNSIILKQKDMKAHEIYDHAAAFGSALGMFVYSIDHPNGHHDSLIALYSNSAPDFDNFNMIISAEIDLAEKFEKFGKFDYQNLINNTNTYITAITKFVKNDIYTNYNRFTYSFKQMIDAMTQFDGKLKATRTRAEFENKKLISEFDKMAAAIVSFNNKTNAPLKNVARNFDAIGKKLKVIGEGMAQVQQYNGASETITQLAQQFVDMQNQSIQTLADAINNAFANGAAGQNNNDTTVNTDDNGGATVNVNNNNMPEKLNVTITGISRTVLEQLKR